jgi:hypothetical protein
VNLRNIVILGCRTLNEIADASPGLSRGLLSKRLRDLERAGILEIRRKLARDRLPQRRTLVRFDYPTLSGPGSRGWLLVERGDGEICETYPGGEEDLVGLSTSRWRSRIGISARSSGATRCVPEPSKCGARGRWREAFPLGAGITNTVRSRATPWLPLEQLV